MKPSGLSGTILPRDCILARLHSAALDVVRYMETAKDTASCYGMQIENRKQAFKWYHFQ